MFNFNDLIGLELGLAKEKLKNNGFKNINIVLNSKHNEKCDTVLVCAVKENNNGITLICGEFFMNIEG